MRTRGGGLALPAQATGGGAEPVCGPHLRGMWGDVWRTDRLHRRRPGGSRLPSRPGRGGAPRAEAVRAWPLVKHIANTAPAGTLGGWVPRRLPVSLVPAPPRAPAAPLRFMGAQVLLALPPFPCVFVLAMSFVLDKCLISLVLASRPSSLPLLGKPDLKSQLLQQATGVISPARTFCLIC